MFETETLNQLRDPELLERVNLVTKTLKECNGDYLKMSKKLKSKENDETHRNYQISLPPQIDYTQINDIMNEMWNEKDKEKRQNKMFVIIGLIIGGLTLIATVIF